MRHFLLLSVLTTSNFWLAPALAAPEGAHAGEAQHGIDVIGEAGASGLATGGRLLTVAEVGFSGSWRVSRRWAFGVGGSVGATGLGASDAGGPLADGAWANKGTTLWKASGLARYDYALVGPMRAWVRGDLGLAFAHDTFDVWRDGRGLGPSSATRTAPFVALLTGAELRPVEAFSVGARVGAEILALGSPEANNATIGVRPAGVFGGLDIGLHFPMD